MYKLKFTTSYKKDYKRIVKRGLNTFLLDEVIEELRQGKKLDERYHDHALKGKYTGFNECHIQPNWLLVYLIEDDILTLTLSRTGRHNDIFDM
jgi:mRNA interferase YafQ